LALLRQALELAQPGGYIRLFVDLGPQLAKLLTASQQTGGDLGYTDQILRAFAASAPAAPPRETPVYPMEHSELVEPLSERERDVLSLQAQRMTDKEIAKALTISPLTVKRHATNIYGKLQVSGRREAVAKAIRLGLL
jgi:LuxR family maltose regulon positive regulatory protein